MKIANAMGVRRWTLIFAIFQIVVGRAIGFASESVKVWEDGQHRFVESDGLPDHAHGQFPNSGNPNHISAQSYRFRMPLHPEASDRTTPLGHDLFGVAKNGVPFDPGTAEYWRNDRDSGWNYEALSGAVPLGIDQNHAHVQPTGAYHYHGVPTGVVESGTVELVGWAADGFPIHYDRRARSSYRLKEGTRPSGPGGHHDGSFVQDWEYVEGAGDLDVCNGREESGGYRYYVTDTFPFVPRCFHGEPDASFRKERPHAPGSNGDGRERRGEERGRRGGPPREAVEACSGKSAGSACEFETPNDALRGTCEDVPENVRACVPA